MEIIKNSQNFSAKIDFTDKSLKLKDFYNKLNLEINNLGEVVQKISVNGDDVNIENIDEDLLICETDKVEVITESPIVIVKNSIDDIVSQLHEFNEEIDKIVANLIKGDRELAFVDFNKFIAKFIDVIKLLQTFETTFKINFAAIEIDGKSIQEYYNRLEDILRETKEAIENEDIVTLTDLLEYEMKDIFTNDLKIVLETLSELLKKTME